MNEVDFLLKNREMEFALPPYLSPLLQQSIMDKYYINFIREFNGGLFFNKSLQIYGNTNEYDFCSLDKINKNIHIEYDTISSGKYFFACDVFGNQFCFDNNASGIYLLNIESGNKDFVANNFLEWIVTLKSETDYYTGESFIIKWEEVMQPLNYGERLATKIPFVLGGEYNLMNLRVERLSKILEFNSSIAKQIFELPDGTPINFKLE